jgi:RNA polymerase sigma-70 factor, ECF subfamily
MNESDLVGRIRDGDTTAWSAVVDAYAERLYRSACFLCGNPTDAEDLAQETFLQAARSLGRFRGESELYTWLHGILLNVVRHARRKAGRLQYTDTLDDEETTPANQGQQLDAEAASAALLAALQKLTPEHREAVVLRYYEQVPVEEISRRTGVGAGTVKSRLHYARQQLSSLLPPELNPFGRSVTHR